MQQCVPQVKLYFASAKLPGPLPTETEPLASPEPMSPEKRSQELFRFIVDTADFVRHVPEFSSPFPCFLESCNTTLMCS